MDKLLALSDLATRWGLPVQWVENRSKDDEYFPPVRLRVDNGKMPLFLLKEIMEYEKEKQFETETITIEFSKDIRLSEEIRLSLQDGRQLTFNDTIYIEGIEKVYNTIKNIKYNGTVYLDELILENVMGGNGKKKGTYIRYISFGNTHTFFRFKTRIKKKNNQYVYTFRFVD
ncbi:hypothetical protein M3193_02110 [Sporosarcina luteola]|uniref:hypothetical protein n=1 Tax=Sporosarcina luteola TaxID=582850 RepID=UPI00203E7A72|nr:hypothetical protein [Sporosarcina luteola]MCM3742926.1 hypothetical protein [Sporosarcina luteola]